MKPGQIILLAGLLIFLAVFLAGCRSTPTLATPNVPGISVGITADTCPNVMVNAGQQVVWTNQDSREHIVRHVPVEENVQFDSGTLQPGDSFTFTFAQIGRYIYDCALDGSMNGTITVQP